MARAKFYKQSAFNASRGLLKHRPLSFPPGQNYVIGLEPLSVVCERHGMSVDQGYRLIKIKVLIAQRFKGKWYVVQNPNCTLPLEQYTRGRYRPRAQT